MRSGGSSEDLVRPRGMSRRLETQHGLRAATAVGVIRDGDGARALRIARGLLEGGLQAVEITATTPDAFGSIRALGSSFADAVLGIGTVRTLEQLEAAAQAGARFVVSPHTDVRLIEAAARMDIAVIPGGLTPTEIVTAAEAGADFVKVFPISAVGGPAYLRYVRGPLPDINYWVSGQVALEDIGDYLGAGAQLVGLTSALTGGLPEDAAAFDETVRQRASTALKAVHDFRDGAALLKMVVGSSHFDIGMKALRKLPGAEHTRLEALIPGRRGHAVRLRVLLQSAGIPAETIVRLVSQDGFERTVTASTLYEGGLLHYATDGHALGKDQGGPLRLYIVQGNDQCDNVKGLTRIETVSKP